MIGRVLVWLPDQVEFARSPDIVESPHRKVVRRSF